MSDIYKEAERVVIWLGEGNEATDLVMDSMKRLQENNIKVEGDWRRSAPLWIGLGDMKEHKATWVDGMNAMLGRPWFRRIWILQEIANARVATIHCGTKSVSARIFAQVPSIIGLQPNSHSQAVLDIMPGLSRKESWWGQNRNLHNLLIKFRESEATDERDTIYALLGISLDACRSKILLPDYTKSVQQVIWETTAFLLSHTGADQSGYEFLSWTLPEFLQNLDSLSSRVLGIASERGQETLVKLLLLTENYLDVHTVDNRGQTPLHQAACNGHETVVRLLLAGRVDINDKDYGDNTPLSQASQYGHQAIIHLLLEKGPEINWKNNIGRTPLSYAAAGGHETAVQLLLENGAQIESRNHSGRTALSYAADYGHDTIVRLLLDKGAQIESRSDAGRTPLSYAKQNQRANTATVQLLLEHGADTTSPDAWKPAPENENGASLAGHDGWTVSPEVLDEMKKHVKEEFDT